MAREGYIEARDALYEAQRNVKQVLREMEELEQKTQPGGEPLPPAFKEMHRQILKDLFENHNQQLDKAKAEWSRFEKPKTKPRRTYDLTLQLHVGMDQPLFEAINKMKKKDKLSHADIARAALMAYFAIKDDRDVTDEPF